MKKFLNIALGFDKKFLPHAATTIKSILVNNESASLYFYILIDDSINFLDKFLLRQMVEKSGNNIKFINMQKNFKQLCVNGWATAMYYPIMLPSICKDQDRVLFLDADTVVTGDLTEFYNTNLEGYLCGAVKDIGMFSHINRKSKLRINDKEEVSAEEYFYNIRNWDKQYLLEKYINSGMLLFNLEEMRKDNIEEKMLKSLDEKQFAFPDQDCINYCCQGRIKNLPIDYNFQILGEIVLKNMEPESVKEYQNYLSNNTVPLIIHFIWKPWKEISKILFQENYYKYRKQTPWRFTFDANIRKKILKFRFSKKQKYLVVFGKTIFQVGQPV